ncbi:MAG TPA: hypothetical protein VF787_17210 [Thermoanaerobaculia bacterium]
MGTGIALAFAAMMLAAVMWIGNRPRFVVTACSRWPDHGRCDQTCTRQIEARPEATLVRSAAGY